MCSGPCSATGVNSPQTSPPLPPRRLDIVIESHFSGPIRNHPDSRAEVLGQRLGAFAQFRHVTAGTKQVLAESPQRPLTGFLVSTAGGAPSIHERFCST